MPAKKYFIALVLPEPLLTEVEAIKQQLFSEYRLKGAQRCPAHITLHRPFEWKEEKENVLIEKLSRLKFNAQFSLELKDFAFFEPRVIYVNVQPNEKLDVLHDNLKLFAKRELQQFNEYNDLRGFHPHVTVASRDLKKELFLSLKEKFLEKTFSGHFSCKQIDLLRLDNTWRLIHSFDI